MPNLLNAIYQTELAPDQWLLGIASAVAPLLDHHCSGVFACRYRCSDPCSMQAETLVRYQIPENLTPVFSAGIGALPPAYVAEKYLNRSHCLSSELCGWDEIPPVKDDRLRAAGLCDLLSVNATELDGFGCAFLSFRTERSSIPEGTRLELSRISRHLAAAHRLRRRRESCAESPATACAAVEPDGRVAHARCLAKGRAAREALTRAVRNREQAKVERGRKGAATAQDDWPVLVEGRWSLVDHFESDGRRHVLAVENLPVRPRRALLSSREREVLRLAQAGCHGKAIAYEMGLAFSTVRVLKSRVVAKLGLRTWCEALNGDVSALVEVVE